MATADDCTLTFIGNATTLLRLGPITLLTDPNFLHRGQFAYLGHGLVSRRRTEPALSPDQLPELDGIVLSHMHGDHWDRIAKRTLDKSLPVITTPKAAKALVRQGFRAALALTTWQSHTVTSGERQVRVTSLPARHAPGPAQVLLPPVMGSMLEYGPVGEAPVLRLYISGDTILIDELRDIPQRYPDIDVAVLHLGGTTLPGGLVVTMTGRDGVDLLEITKAHRAVPVHYDDYGVFKSPLSDFTAEIGHRGLTDRVLYAVRGVATPLT